MRSMEWILFLFCAHCMLQYGLACSTAGPERCVFSIVDPSTGKYDITEWCSYTPDGGLELVREPMTNRTFVIRLAQNKDYGLLTSRESCPMLERCFVFLVLFSSVGDIDLNVYIVNSNNGKRIKLWSALSSYSTILYSSANVPISADFIFTVQLEAVRRPNRPRSDVYIQVVDFYNVFCEGDSHVLVTATPSPTTTTTTTTTTPAITTTSTTTTATTTTSTTTTTPTTSTPKTPTTTSVHVPHQSITYSTLTTPSTSQETGANNSNTDTTANIGAIVGPIVAVIVLLGIVVCILVILKTNKKLCFKQEQSKYAEKGATCDLHSHAVGFSRKGKALGDTAHPPVVSEADDDDAQFDSMGDCYEVVEMSGGVRSSLGDNRPPNPYATLGERSPPNPYSTLGAPPTENVYSDVDPTSSENTYTGLGARSPPNVYLSIGQTPDHNK